MSGTTFDDAAATVTITAKRPVPAPLGTTAQPTLKITVNGTTLLKAAAATITRLNSYSLDTFSVRAGYSDDCAQDQAWFADLLTQTPLKVAIYISMGGAFGDPLFTGIADEMPFNPWGGGCTITGRSLGAPLADTQIIQAYPNRTSSEVATLLAQKYSLTPQVTATTTPAGHYYSTDYVMQQFGAKGANRTEWDLLTALAEREGFALYIDGSTLVFAPVDVNGDGTFPVRVAGKAGRNPIGLTMTANIRLDRPIKVTVLSHHPGTFQSVEGTATAPGFGPVLEFKYQKPRWDAARADAWAKKELVRILEQRFTTAFKVPHQMSRLTPRTIIPISGFGAPADGRYFVRQITTSADMSGFWDHVECTLTNPLDGEQAEAAGGDE